MANTSSNQAPALADVFCHPGDGLSRDYDIKSFRLEVGRLQVQDDGWLAGAAQTAINPADADLHGLRAELDACRQQVAEARRVNEALTAQR